MDKTKESMWKCTEPDLPAVHHASIINLCIMTEGFDWSTEKNNYWLAASKRKHSCLDRFYLWSRMDANIVMRGQQHIFFEIAICVWIFHEQHIVNCSSGVRARRQLIKVFECAFARQKIAVSDSSTNNFYLYAFVFVLNTLLETGGIGICSTQNRELAWQIECHCGDHLTKSLNRRIKQWSVTKSKSMMVVVVAIMIRELKL